MTPTVYELKFEIDYLKTQVNFLKEAIVKLQLQNVPKTNPTVPQFSPPYWTTTPLAPSNMPGVSWASSQPPISLYKSV